MHWVEFSVIVVWRRGMASGRLASTRNVFNRCHLTKRKRCCAVNVADLFDVAAASRLDHVRRRCRKACRSAAAALQAALRGFGVRRGVPNVVRLRAQAAARRQVDAHLARSCIDTLRGVLSRGCGVRGGNHGNGCGPAVLASAAARTMAAAAGTAVAGSAADLDAHERDGVWCQRAG